MTVCTISLLHHTPLLIQRQARLDHVLQGVAEGCELVRRRESSLPALRDDEVGVVIIVFFSWVAPYWDGSSSTVYASETVFDQMAAVEKPATFASSTLDNNKKPGKRAISAIPLGVAAL